MKNKLARKLILVAVVFLQIFALTALPALAVSFPSVGSIASQLEKRYHMNLESIQSQAESFNVSDTKKMAPQVTLSFSPAAPEFGEKITATAMPIYFSSTNESMYFTWYLKHNSSGGKDGKGNWDHNGDDDVDIDDYKIEAARLIATNGYDNSKANYDDPADDKDGYRANFGGDDKNDMPDHCYIHDFNNGINYELISGGTSESVTFPGCIGGTVYCAQQEDQVCSDIVGGSFESASVCTETTTPQCVDGQTQCSSGSAYCITGSFPDNDDCSSDVSCSSLGNSYSNGSCSVTASGSEKNGCKHLFPNAPGHKTAVEESDKYIFGEDEERFWRTNPEDPDTADNGNKDEANVAGLGQTSFSWNYQPGDKVGVAVEGIANFPTKYADASQAVMWAFAKNDCEPENQGSITKNIKGYDVTIPTAKTDLNDCLKNNFVDPLEEGSAPKLDVSLSYFPKNPVNDASAGESADELVVSASVTGAKDNNFLNYRWKVFHSKQMSLNDSDWTLYSKSDLDGSGATQGIGVDSLKFKLNFDPAPKYLKVNLDVSENSFVDIKGQSGSAIKTGQGHASVIIPLSSSSEKIKVYPVSVVSENNELKLKPGNDELCAEGMNKITCPVAKNELVRLEITKGSLTDFLWTIDGAPIPLADDTCSMGECIGGTGASTNVAYFPVLKEKGEKYNIGLAATNSATGEKINLSRAFEVVDPQVRIISLDENTAKPVLLGNYLDLDGRAWPDYSEDAFEGIAGADISLKAKIDMPLAGGFAWFIDGIEMNTTNAAAFGASVAPDTDALTFRALKNIGESYSVGIRGLYTQDNNTKRYLHEKWEVGLNEFYETPVEDSIEITLAASLADQQANAGGTQKILATLATGLPGYIAFLFRIVLTTVLILATAWIFMSLTPKNNEN